MCNEDIVCEVAAVEAVCEEILADAEEEFNSIGFYRRKRSISTMPLIPSWPGTNPDEPLEVGWKYWIRGGDNIPVKRVRRGILEYNNHEDLDHLSRHKRQFGFSLDELLLGEGRPTTTPASATQAMQQTDSNQIGALIDVISRSMSSDVGSVQFASFLDNFQTQDGTLTSEDFLTAFSQEFGEDKIAALQKLTGGKFGLIGFSANQSSSSFSSFSSSSSSSFSSSQSVESGSSGESQQRPSITKKAFKLRFNVQGLCTLYQVIVH